MTWQVVILGGGYGGLTAARRLEQILPDESARVTLISDQNFMLNTTLLPGASGGTLEPRHVVVPLREELRNTDIRLATVIGHNHAERSVRYVTLEGEESSQRYDQLIVALGSTARLFPIPGLREHAVGLKTLPEAIALRNRLIKLMERAEVAEDIEERRMLLTFVFVGAGYAGVEGLAELQDLARDIVHNYPRCRLTGMRFILVEARERIMYEIDPGLAEFASAELRKRGIKLLTNTRLERIEADSVTLSDGTVIPCGTVCWTAGVTPVPVIAELGLPLDKDRIAADRYCQVRGVEDVWAVGDCAAIPDPARKGQQPCPPTAQHGMRQGRTAATNVARRLANRSPKPFRYKTLGVFVDMGRQEAVAETVGIKWRGFPAWFLARTYHLAQMPGYKRRLRITIDWTVALLFRRDSTVLDTAPRTARASAPSAAAESGGEKRVGFTGVALDD